jgi:cytochrome c biogenesis protein
MLFNGKTPFTGGGLIADVPAEHRLSPSNPTFRGNLLVTEGTTAGTAILAQPNGVMLQDLPFSVELKKFIVEYYDTGMPKLFASDITIHDHETGEKKDARVEVNHPASHRGINIYQSSFDDGGSKVTLQAVPLNAPTRPFEVTGVIGGSTQLANGSDKLTLEFTGLRVINVENFAGESAGSATDVRTVDLRTSIESRLGSGHKSSTEKTLRNVGPSISYKLRDAAGQAVEYNNYMLPMELDGSRMYLMGLRESPSEPLRYLRIPADAQDSMDDFIRLRAALADPAMRAEAVKRYAASAVEGGRSELAQALEASATRAMDLFAGAERIEAKSGEAGAAPQLVKGGLPAVSVFLENNVPEGERERASDVLVRILNGSLFQLMQISRERESLPALAPDEATQKFMTSAVVSLSDSFYYPAPMILRLKDFTHVQASVFQVARAPGQNIVYLGCLLLILGVFAMLYVRERRVWVWLAPSGSGQSQASMALSSNRKTMEADREFEILKVQLLKVPS